jgi:membrane-bound serine protease (ClpP class)
VLALGVGLFVLAAVLLLLEAHASTGGLLGGAAILAAVGSVALLLLAAGTGLVVGFLVALVVGGIGLTALLVGARKVLVARGRRPHTGPRAMVGHVGVVRTTNGRLRVFVDGALWRAVPDRIDGASELHAGDHVVVEHVDGLTLSVRKADELELTR